MVTIRALALCAFVALACAASCAVADQATWPDVTPVGDVPRPHTGIYLASDPFAYDGGLERAASDEEVAANYLARQGAPSVRSPGTPCGAQGGTCQSTVTSPCTGGQWLSGLCPGASDVMCCKKGAPAPAPRPDPSTPCGARQGVCKEAALGCAGQWMSGLCPGATTRCCILASSPSTNLPKPVTPAPAPAPKPVTPAPTPAPAPAPAQPASPCTAEGGLCKEPSAGCSGKFQSGLCPGATAKCCLPPPMAPCPAAGGSCKEPSAGCAGGTFQSGLCPGTGKCCLPAGAACIANKGTCKEQAAGCAGGQWYSGMCPGTATCCVSNSVVPAGTAHCGIYATSPKSTIEGNDGVIYNVVKVAKAHLTDMSMYEASPLERDNTMAVATACAFNVLRSFAAKAGHSITINSAFRTYARQEYFWMCYQTGSCNDGNRAAYPGGSDHGTGCAVDLDLSDAAYNWMAENAHKHGFVRTVWDETWHWEYRPGWARAPYT